MMLPPLHHLLMPIMVPWPTPSTTRLYCLHTALSWPQRSAFSTLATMPIILSALDTCVSPPLIVKLPEPLRPFSSGPITLPRSLESSFPIHPCRSSSGRQATTPPVMPTKPGLFIFLIGCAAARMCTSPSNQRRDAVVRLSRKPFSYRRLNSTSPPFLLLCESSVCVLIINMSRRRPSLIRPTACIARPANFHPCRIFDRPIVRFTL